MKKVLLIISYLLIFISCTRSIDQQKYLETRLKQVNAEYQQDIKETQISSDLLNLFPNRIEYMPTSRKKAMLQVMSAYLICYLSISCRKQ